MDRTLEYRETMDYMFVINKQLDRIAKVRSSLGNDYTDSVDDPSQYLMNMMTQYYYHVSTLHAILLPELRGESGKYLDAAKKLATLIHEINTLRDEIESLKSIAFCLPKGVGSRWDERFMFKGGAGSRQSQDICTGKTEGKTEKEIELERLLEARRKFVENLPAKDPVGLIDKALEEMLSRLNSAGLLLKSRYVKIGV